MDYTELGIRNGRPFTVSRGTDGTDPAFRVGLRNPSHSTYTAATVTVNAGTSLVFTITGHASSPFTFNFATYLNMGTLLDAVELDANLGPIIWIRRNVMLRAHLTASSALAALSATTIRSNAGQSVFWDTTVYDRRGACMGDEEDTSQTYGAARSTAATLPIENDGEEQLNQAFKAKDSLCAITSIVANATWTAAAHTISVYELTNKPGDTDPDPIYTFNFTGTGADQTIRIGPPGMASVNGVIGHGIRASRPGRRLLVLTGSGPGANITSSVLTVNGVIGQ